MKKPTKPFGVWTDSSYVAKVDDNAKVYRKIGDMRRYFRRHGIKKSLRDIIKELKNPKTNPLWAKRMKYRSVDSWRKHFYDQ